MYKKKLIFFFPSFERGGAAKILIRVINYFLKKNVNILLFSSNAKYHNFVKSKKLKIIGIKKKYRSRIKINLLISFYLMKFLFFNKEKFIIFSFQSHLPAIILSKLFNKKIFIRNSEEIFGATKYADHKFSASIVLFLKVIFYNFADKIVAISKKSKTSLEKITINKRKIKLIYNPSIFYKKNFTIRKNPKKNFNILSIGRFTKQKNFILIIRAVNDLIIKYPFIKLTLVGSGPLKKSLINFSSKNIQILNWNDNIKKYSWAYPDGFDTEVFSFKLLKYVQRNH